MKIKTSPYERAINRLARGDGKDCDLADELEKAVRARMAEEIEGKREGLKRVKVVEDEAEKLLRLSVYVINGREFVDAAEARECALRIRDIARGAP
jgi:hypothetical protein